MTPMYRARTGTLVSFVLVVTLGVVVSLCGAVYLPEDGPPLPLEDVPVSVARTPADDGILTVIPGKAKPPPSERVLSVPVQRSDGCIDAVFARKKRATHLRVTQTDDAVITDIVHTKPVPVRQVIRQRSRAPKFICPERWRGLDLSDPNALECPENSTGFFPFPPDCRKYLNCWRGRGTVQPCSPATFFDPVRRECDYPEKVKCLPDCYAPGTSGSSVTPESDQYFENVPVINVNNENGIEGNNDHNDGFGARNPGGQGFIDLSQNNQDPITDDYGIDPSLYVNPSDPSGHSPLLDVRNVPKGKITRVRPNAGRQQIRKQTPVTERPGEGEQLSRSRRYVYSSSVSKYCQMEGGSGLAPDPEHCGRFYNCDHGRAYLQDCAAGTLFSERLRNCDHSHLVNCGSRPRNGRPQTPYETPSDPYNPDSQGAFASRPEVRVPYYRPTYPSIPSPSGKSIPFYQPTPERNPDAGYRPYPTISQTPKPVFFRPFLPPQHVNHQIPNQDSSNQEHHHHYHPQGQETTTSKTPNYYNHHHNHPTNSPGIIHNHHPHMPFQHNHPPNTPFQHNHPPNTPFQHNHPPNVPFQHSHSPNIPFQHNHPPNTPFQHNHPPHNHNLPPRIPPNYSPQSTPQSSPSFHTALNPLPNQSSYGPQKGSQNPIPREQNPIPEPPKDEITDDQSPQSSDSIGNRRPIPNPYGSNPTAGGVRTPNQGPKKPENNPSLYPVKPQGREDWWTSPDQAEETTPCPTTGEPLEGEADRNAWIDLVNKTRSARTPMADQWVRLRGGRSTLEGLVEILGPGATWGGVCDAENAWTIEKASIVCKQLGFERGAEAAWQGGPTSNKITHVDSVTCGEGAPTLLHCALQRGWNEYACDASTRAAFVRCLPNWSSKCQPGETLRGDRCYRLFTPTNEMVDLAHSASEAVEHCRSRGGHIVDVNSQSENDFLTDWLATEHPDVDAILTSGLGVRVKDRSARDLWIWQTDSYSPMGYTKWWPGWSNRSGSSPDVGDRTLCVILKKSYPCADRRSGEACPADYMYWHAVDCAQRGQLYPYVCERKGDDIGCVDGTAAEYKGTANVTASGRACLPWNDPRVVSNLRYRVSEQSRRETLSGHNYCRKVTGNREPWCYVDYGNGIEIRAEDCQIPPCWDRGTTNTNADDEDELWPTGNQAVPPWQYAPYFPHMIFEARVYQDNVEENSVETDQGVAASDVIRSVESPYEAVDPNSFRESSGWEADRRLTSTTARPGLVPDPIIRPKPWSRPRQERNNRFTTTPAPTDQPDQEVVSTPDMSQADRKFVSTTLKPYSSVSGPAANRPTSRPRPYRPNRSTTLPPTTNEPDQKVVNPPNSAFDEIFTDVPPEQSLDQYPYGNGPESSGIQTVGVQPSPSRTLKPPHITQNPQYPQVRKYRPQQPPPQQNPPYPYPTQANRHNPQISNTSPQIPENPQHSESNPNRQNTLNSNLPEIPLDVHDPIPDQLVVNPVMPPSYPDGRPPIPSDEKPPIVSRGGFPGTSNDPVEGYNEPYNENELSENNSQSGITPFNELLRILHQRYGQPDPPLSYYNGHTGPMGWYSPLMVGPNRSARSSPESTGTTPHIPFTRLVEDESENVMKIPQRKSNEKEQSDVPRYFM